MKELEFANQQMRKIKQLIQTTEKANVKGPFFAGVDLGTASIVFIVVDQNGIPVFSAIQDANVVRDGLVVNYSEAVAIVKKLKYEAEEFLGESILSASGAIPPGTTGNNRRAVGHVIESAEMEVNQIVDEPTAAALALNVKAGAVVDIGGGTTGISIFEDEQVSFVADEPTGGTQMTLVLSGALKLPIQEGEKVKRDHEREKDNFMIIKPVVEKMATITKNFLNQYERPVEQIYLVGGATKFSEFAAVFEKQLKLPILHPEYPEFVTPLGIALASREEVCR